MRATRPAAAVAASALAFAVAGCGLGAGAGTSDVTITVTRDFGQERIGAVTERHVPGSETVMRTLERAYAVRTRYGGGFVQSIGGLSGDSAHHDWFYYVNGIEAPQGAATTTVHRGDRIWWDLHDWSVTDDVPAVVGSFPEPFVHGSGGRRLPTTLECAADVGTACRQVTAELERIGIPVAISEPGSGSGTDSLAVVVGTWQDLKGEIVASLIAHGPAASGVYARFGPGGASLQLLDRHGQVARSLGAGSGLVAATAQPSSEPTWMITGTDPAGVAAAAAAMTPGRLADHFAVAVAAGGDVPVPVSGGP